MILRHEKTKRLWDWVVSLTPSKHRISIFFCAKDLASSNSSSKYSENQKCPTAVEFSKNMNKSVYELADNLNVGAIIKHNPSTNLR
jgi:hypothetical protein